MVEKRKEGAGMEYGLIGEKLGHSYSTQIHALFGNTHYQCHPLTKQELPDFMQKKDFLAINVTIPYKKDVIPYMNEMDSSAQMVGAVNTIINRNGILCGYNTDYYGFCYLLKKSNINVTGKKVLVLGNGGAAQAVFASLNTLKAKEIYVVKYKIEPGTITYEEARRQHSDAEIIINTTPVGMYPDVLRSPMSLEGFHQLEAVVDVIANPMCTTLMKEAMKKNIKAVNGLMMLVAQAKYAAELFFNSEISEEKIDEVYEAIKKSM